MNSIPPISERSIPLPVGQFSAQVASLGHNHSAFFHTTRLSCHHIAMQCHHKVILHQAQGYFRKLSNWIQQAFRAGIRPTLPKSGLQSCRTGANDALSVLSSITHLPSHPTPHPRISGFPHLFAWLSDSTTFVFPHVCKVFWSTF